MNKHHHVGQCGLDIQAFSTVTKACDWYAAHFEEQPVSVPRTEALLQIDVGTRQSSSPPVIGIIGISYPATRDFLLKVAEVTGGSARYLVHSRDFDACYSQAQTAGDWTTVGNHVLDSARKLASAEAEILCMPANTTHKAEAIAPLLASPPANTNFVSMVDAVARAAQRMGCRKVAILGTSFTMQDHFYPDAFAASNSPDATSPEVLEALLPSRIEDIQAVSEAIFNRMLRNVWLEEDAALCNAVMQRMAVEQGADAVALACTELPMLFAHTGVECSLPAIDTTQVLASAVADACGRQ